jgi:transcriptional regulator with XRE-family HTH domain/tetratricopeptide (TPR) repeat protein
MATKRRQFARARKAAGHTQESLAEHLGIDRTTVARWEAGETEPLPWQRPRIAEALGVPSLRLDELLNSTGDALGDDALPAPDVVRQALPDLRHVEHLRRALDDTLSDGMMAEASLDDWERTVVQYGRATRDSPAGMLLNDLSTDLNELQRALQRHRSASALRRLTRVATHMAGLMCLTLCRLDDRPAFRRWARTARLAASEAGDPVAHSWALAQEAYGHYYSGDLLEAVDVARHAQDLVRTTPCVGAALAAALEARAHAALGRHQQTRAALAQAEDILSRLDEAVVVPSAFGYTEAQLRFHEGNAYTHLRDARAAFKAQNRALELCVPGDYTDWAMTRLDRASCLIDTGDPSDAVAYATETLTALSKPERQGIITLRGHEILKAIPASHQRHPATHELHELLMLTTDTEGFEGP